MSETLLGIFLGIFSYLSLPIISQEALVIVFEISTNKIEQNHKNNNKHWIFYQSEICHSCADDLGKTVTFMTSLALLALKFYDSIWLKESESEVTQSCPSLRDPMDCSLPGSSVHGIFQARVLEWVAISFSRGSSRRRDRTRVSCIPGRHFSL